MPTILFWVFNTELTPSGSCRSFGTGWLHPLLRGEAPDIKSSAAREISAKVRESQKREGLGFSLATLLPVSDGEPPELDQTRLVRM
jgi:hypothetical protein